MQTLRHALSVVLAFMILSSGLPLFGPGDVNRDMRVDLKDVIIHVRELARAADNPEEFLSQAEKAISAFRLVAGVKAQIWPPRDAKSLSPFAGVSQVYLIPSEAPLSLMSNPATLSGYAFHYRSVILLPDTPPPRFV